MALILGTEYCKVDSNGRFRFPIALKKRLGGEDFRFAMRQCPVARCLELWPYASFEAEAARLRGTLNLYNIADNKMYLRLTNVSLVDLDGSDRMMLPPERRGLLGTSKEIVLHAAGDCIQIWERGAYDKMMNMESEFDENFAMEVNNRLGKTYGVPSASDAE